MWNKLQDYLLRAKLIQRDKNKNLLCYKTVFAKSQINTKKQKIKICCDF